MSRVSLSRSMSFWNSYFWPITAVGGLMLVALVGVLIYFLVQHDD
jgi:hypothetical protein